MSNGFGDYNSRNKEDWKVIQSVREIVGSTIKLNAEKVDRCGEYPFENIEVLKESGLLSLITPKEYGGLGCGPDTFVEVISEIAKECPSTALILVMHYSVIPILVSLGNDTQQREEFADILSGKSICAAATSEKGSGNRVWHMDGFAKELPGINAYELNAFKSFATGSRFCDFYLVPVRDDESSGVNELSVFLFQSDVEGLDVIGEWNSMGLRGTSSSPLKLTGTKVDQDFKLGENGDGYSYLTSYHLPYYLLGLAAAYLGIAKSALAASVEHVKARVHTDTGASLSSVESVQATVGEMYVNVQQCESHIKKLSGMTERAFNVFDELNSCGLLKDVIEKTTEDSYLIDLVSMKTNVCKSAVSVVDSAFQICGGAAYKKGHKLERMYRDVRAGSVMAPAEDTAKVIIGKKILGFPQEWV